MGRRKAEESGYNERLERFEKYSDIVAKNIYRREIQLDTNNDVAIANNMILHSASNLSLNELKLLRFIIMQTKKGDTELYKFDVGIKELAKALEINSDFLYREIEKMTKHLMQEVIYIGDRAKDKWIMFHWVDICEYNNGNLTIKISDELKPFLVGLRGNFTRYQLSDIIALSSIYAIRIYEILNGYMNDNNLPYADNAVEISVSVDDIRRATDTVNKFERFSNFKSKVVDKAIKEINAKSRYHVIATPYKSGRQVVGFDFLIESQAGYAHRMAEEPKQIKKNNSDGQLTLEEFF